MRPTCRVRNTQTSSLRQQGSGPPYSQSQPRVTAVRMVVVVQGQGVGSLPGTEKACVLIRVVVPGPSSQDPAVESGLGPLL